MYSKFLSVLTLILGLSAPVYAQIISLPTSTPTHQTPPEKAQKVSLKELYRNPDKYLGKTIRVEGRLQQSWKSKRMHWLGRVITRSDEGLTDGDYGLFIGSLTVIDANASKAGANAIRLTGTLQQDDPAPTTGTAQNWAPFQKPGYSFRARLSDVEYVK